MSLEKLKYLVAKIGFYKFVIYKFVIILFRKNKEIEKLQLEYNTEYLFDNSYVILNYRFKNAIYYQFDNHKTTEKKIKILNLKQFNHKIELTVHGFFQKKVYEILLEPKLTLNSESFKTHITNLSIKKEEHTIPKLIKPVQLTSKKIKIKTYKTITKRPKTTLLNTTYKQNDFL